MQNLKKFLVITLVFLTIIFSLTSCNTNVNSINNNIQKDKNLLLVHYIDVGQADSILVQVNGMNMLIDAGNRADGSYVVSYLQKQGVKKLDYLIATHPDEDHIGGMSTVIKKYMPISMYAPKKTKTTKTFENMIAALNGKKITSAKAGIKLDLGENVQCEFLAPNSDKYEETNNYSIVIKLTYGDNKFLFMGDAEKLSETEILSNKFDVSTDVLKVGHHGSSSSSSKDFLNKANPKIAVISCGKDNEYGHPNKETLSELKKRNIKLYRTDIDGTIILKSDGKTISKI